MMHRCRWLPYCWCLLVGWAIRVTETAPVALPAEEAVAAAPVILQLGGNTPLCMHVSVAVIEMVMLLCKLLLYVRITSCRGVSKSRFHGCQTLMNSKRLSLFAQTLAART